MAKILYNHWYSKAEIDLIFKENGMQDAQLKGYYLETDGKRFRLIHDKDTVLSNQGKRFDQVLGNPWGEIAPIVKRTPQQRLDSMVQPMVADCIAAGCVPGFSDEKMTELLGRPWCTGQSIMTVTVAREIAAIFLWLAEKKREKDESRFIVRPSQNDILVR